MTLSNYIELAVLTLNVIALVALRRYTKRRLSEIDGCGEVYQAKDVEGKTVVHK